MKGREVLSGRSLSHYCKGFVRRVSSSHCFHNCQELGCAGHLSYEFGFRGFRIGGILRSMMKANGLIVIPEDQERVKVVEKVRVQVLD